MVLVYAILLLIAIALVLRRDLGNIAHVSLKGGWYAAVTLIGLIILQAVVIILTPGSLFVRMILLVSTQVALLVLLLVNYRLPGAKLFALGIFLNTLVMIANGGWMPVSPETAQFVHPERTTETYSIPPNSKNIILPRSETNLWILSDTIRLTLPWRRNAISLGDVLLIVGAAQFIFQSTAHSARNYHQAPEAL